MYKRTWFSPRLGNRLQESSVTIAVGEKRTGVFVLESLLRSSSALFENALGKEWDTNDHSEYHQWKTVVRKLICTPRKPRTTLIDRAHAAKPPFGSPTTAE
jgi:hypothetical protein